MGVEVALVAKGFAAHGTDVRFVARVDVLMREKVGAGGKSFPAQRTGLGLLPGVDAAVFGQATLQSVGSLTHVAGIRSFSCVDPLMRLEQGRRAVPFPTLMAQVRLVTGVSSQVRGEAGAAGKALPTHATAVRSLPGVDSHMFGQT